ncbi:putative bacteriophage DNA transposition protein B [Haemophilus influenzae HK1212]|uniref:Putative bacteriophage DNA transposition protein B n=1 Tax=Haemophilus influenzae HK1212 TaxID=456482 RepID=A0A7G2JYP0_HAEIF|nr:putative bacteriophage DNA transposition protein B [Haemophilus influenzae HK1212]
MQRLDDKVAEYLARQDQKILKAHYNSQFVSTLAARKTMDVMQYAHTEGKIVVVYGAAGLGKTATLKEYAARYPSSMLIETDPGYNPRVLLHKIAENCGVVAQGGNHDVFEKIVEKLDGSERLLIIDEAELLSTRSLELKIPCHNSHRSLKNTKVN